VESSKFKRNKSNETAGTGNCSSSNVKRETLLPETQGEIRLRRVNAAIAKEQSKSMRLDRVIANAKGENV
jgi:hypothetical protein